MYEKQKPFTISPIDERFLRAVYRYHMLKPEQLTRLYYSAGSLTFVKARLKRLVDYDYLNANEQATTRGRSPFYYTLAGKGIKYLKDIGLDTNRYYRPSRQASYLPFLLHTFSVNDVLIAAEVLTATTPWLRLAEMQHELDLKQSPCKVPVSQESLQREGAMPGKFISIIPDGWLDFRLVRGGEESKRRMCIWLELDRGTEGMKDLKAKIASILDFYQSGGYQQRFGTSSLRIAFATTAGAARVRQIEIWLRDILTKKQAKPVMAARFVATALPEQIDPHTLFLEPVWHVPSDTSSLVSLLATA